MSCNCRGDRFFTRPIENTFHDGCRDDRRDNRRDDCRDHHRDNHRDDCRDHHRDNRRDDCRDDHRDNRRDNRRDECNCRPDCRCGGCGCHSCRCTAKSVIPGCCTGLVGGATLKDGLCAFVNRKVLIRVGCETLCVVIAEVCDCVLKAICPKTGKVLYFNLDRIVDVQDIYS